MATASTPSQPTRPSYHLRPQEKYLSVEEYLRSGYDPDMDYVDGHLEERNLGEVEHAELQGAILGILSRNQREWGIRVMPECRLQVRPDKFRVPDILVLTRGEKPKRIVREAPLLCIEVLSPEDTMRRIVYRVNDYVAMGVRHVWILDPEDGSRVFVVDGDERRWTQDRILRVPGTEIRVDLDAIAAELAD